MTESKIRIVIRNVRDKGINKYGFGGAHNRSLFPALNQRPNAVSRVAGISRWLQVSCGPFSTNGQTQYQGFRGSAVGYERAVDRFQPTAKRSIKGSGGQPLVMSELWTVFNHWLDVVSRPVGISRWLRVGSVHFSTTSLTSYQGFQPSTSGYEWTLSNP